MDLKPHLTCAHRYWKHWIVPGDTVIDATVGNGQDTFFLATLLEGKGNLIGYDIQQAAIDKTKERIQALPEAERKIISLKCQSHAQIEAIEAKLIVYNLGYLPGGNKEITTQVESTLKSLGIALNLALQSKGALSIMCYPGHNEGWREQTAILEYLKNLCSKQWNICFHQWINRLKAPSLLWLQSQ